MTTFAVSGGWEVEYDADVHWLNDQIGQGHRNGWRPVCIDSYIRDSPPNRELYVVSWQQTPANWSAAFGVDAGGLAAFLDAQQTRNPQYLPTMMCVTETVGGRRFGVVCEPIGMATQVVHFAGYDCEPNSSNCQDSHRDLREKDAYLRERGWTCKWLALARGNFHSAIYHETGPHAVRWANRPQYDLDRLDVDIAAFSQGGVRPFIIATADSARDPYAHYRYSTLWHDDQVGPYCVFAVPGEAPGSTLDLQSAVQQCAAQGYFPYRITAGQRTYYPPGQATTAQRNAAVEFVVIAQPTDQPIARTERIRRLGRFLGGFRHRTPTDAGDEQVTDWPFQTGNPPAEGGAPPPPKPTKFKGVKRVPEGGIGPGTRLPWGRVKIGSEPRRIFEDIANPRDAIERYMLDHMKSHGIRAGSLAIAIQGRLAYAGAFTWAEPAYPTTTPTDAFRMYSISKTITSIGLFKLDEMESMTNLSANWSRKITEFTGVVFAPGANLDPPQPLPGPADAKWQDIRMRHLLTHDMRWVDEFDGAKIWREEFNNYSFHALEDNVPDPPGAEPSRKSDWVAYLTSLNPIIASTVVTGNQSYYCNENFLLLGHVLQERTNTDYTYWMADNVWSKVGVPGADQDNQRVWVSLRGKRDNKSWGAPLPNEVRLEQGIPSVQWANWDRERLVTAPYGWNGHKYAEHGGWSAPPLDMARLYASVGQARLLNPATRDFMWADAGNGFTKGGFGYGGGSVYGFAGRSQGGSAYAEYESSNEITIVYAFNVDPPTYLSSSGKDEGWLDLPLLRDLVYRALGSGVLDEDLWSLAGYTEPF